MYLNAWKNVMATISFENACKISSRYCQSIKGDIMEEFLYSYHAA